MRNQTNFKFGRLRSLAMSCTFLLLATVVVGPMNAGAQETDEGASGRYFVEGTVTDESTGMPIAEATVSILVRSEQDPDKRSLTGLTDERGHYRIAVPMGQVSLWFPPLKPGYWLAGMSK